MIVIDEKYLNERTLRLVQGDITERDVDVIVNAANSHLNHAGGVAGAIVLKGGSIIQEESDRIGYVPVGSVAITSSGNLPCKAVIHAVGPMMGEGDEDNKLEKAIQNTLMLAAKKGYGSISIPAISSGIFGFPKDKCAKILVSVSKKFLENNENSLNLIEFCIYDEKTLEHFQREFSRLQG